MKIPFVSVRSTRSLRLLIAVAPWVALSCTQAAPPDVGAGPPEAIEARAPGDAADRDAIAGSSEPAGPSAAAGSAALPPVGIGRGLPGPVEVAIERHVLWVATRGQKGERLRASALGRAVLMRQSSLSGKNLRGADLSDAALQRSNLSAANLRGVDLRRSLLQGTSLMGADLAGADLRGATGVTCEQLASASGWDEAYRDPTLACGRPIPDPPADLP